MDTRQGQFPSPFGRIAADSSATEAEDLVQDVWLRWQGTDRSMVHNPGAFLATTTTRLAINELQSARARRETYIGPWLPEPVDTSADPFLGAERGEALELAVLMLMERLTPTERAAYVLREAFDYPYAQIADIRQSTEAAVRQQVSRARKVVAGASRVAKFVAAFSSWYWDGVDVRWMTANGQPAAVLHCGDTLLGVVVVDASADGIEQVLWIMNPDKLAAAVAVTD